MSGEVVRAAGGIVIRREADDVQVLLVHRPRYDDWSFPKGKLQEGEGEPDGALREVREETGYRCAVDHEVDRVRYVDQRGRDKEVVYFRMTARGREGFQPNAEVDDVRWASIGRAAVLLTWPRDVSVLRRAVEP